MLVTLNEVLPKAQKEKYAVGLFNTIDMEMANGVLAAAENMKSPVIIGTAEILLPFGGLEELAWLLRPMAQRASVPVVLHFDHGLKEETVYKAIDLGFSSVMYDCSDKSFDENIKALREMTKYAHSKGVSVEAEIGHVGNAMDGDEDLTDMNTTPEEAEAYIRATGVDALDVAIGSAHGVYKKKPMLNIERLKEIRAKVDTPLVLHGGSGLSDDDFRETIREGIAKVNIFTDLCLAGDRAVAEGLEKGIGYLETRNLKVAYIKEEVKKKMQLFGSVGKA